jgi:ankyrin repeat protein
LRKVILLLFFSQRTPLHISAYFGHLEVARLLLLCNADIEAKDSG